MTTLLDKKENLFKDIPDVYRIPLLEEFNKILSNYRESRWEPAELDGGRFSEIVYSILDCYLNSKFGSGPIKPKNMLQACKNLENFTTFPRSLTIQIPRMLIALYEIRNNRNVGHVGADVDPNYMDATVVVQLVKWIMGELIRVFHSISTEEASEIVNMIIERSLPIVWKFNNSIRILNNKISAKDKMMALLYSEQKSLSVDFIIHAIEYKNITRFREEILKVAHKECLINFDSKNSEVLISPVGIAYVEKNITLEL